MGKNAQAKEPEQEVEFITPDEIYAKGKYIFIAKKDSINAKVYKISGSLLEEKDVDMKISDFDVYFPADTDILYFVFDEIVLLFGKDFTDESLATLVGVLNKLDDMVANILKPAIKNPPKWFPAYEKKLEVVAKKMETFLGTEEAIEENSKSK